MFPVDSGTCFGPKFGHRVVERTATGEIVRDNKPIALIDAGASSLLLTLIAPCVPAIQNKIGKRPGLTREGVRGQPKSGALQS